MRLNGNEMGRRKSSIFAKQNEQRNDGVWGNGKSQCECRFFPEMAPRCRPRWVLRKMISMSISECGFLDEVFHPNLRVSRQSILPEMVSGCDNSDSGCHIPDVTFRMVSIVIYRMSYSGCHLPDVTFRMSYPDVTFRMSHPDKTSRQHFPDGSFPMSGTGFMAHLQPHSFPTNFDGVCTV